MYRFNTEQEAIQAAMDKAKVTGKEYYIMFKGGKYDYCTDSQYYKYYIDANCVAVVDAEGVSY